MELFDYYYDAVDNDTLKAAYETIFNWTYIESAGPARDSSTTTYIFLGVSGSFILLIIVMDFTHLVSFAILPPYSVMGHGYHISISINAYALELRDRLCQNCLSRHHGHNNINDRPEWP